MATIKIDEKEYDTETLNEKAKATIISLQFVNTELKRLEAQVAVYKTAEAGYLTSLKNQLEGDQEDK